jgi:hypothetical protein
MRIVSHQTAIADYLNLRGLEGSKERGSIVKKTLFGKRVPESIPKHGE